MRSQKVIQGQTEEGGINRGTDKGTDRGIYIYI